jgi:hypothetical protein
VFLIYEAFVILFLLDLLKASVWSMIRLKASMYAWSTRESVIVISMPLILTRLSEKAWVTFGVSGRESFHDAVNLLCFPRKCHIHQQPPHGNVKRISLEWKPLEINFECFWVEIITTIREVSVSTDRTITRCSHLEARTIAISAFVTASINRCTYPSGDSSSIFGRGMTTGAACSSEVFVWKVPEMESEDCGVAEAEEYGEWEKKLLESRRRSGGVCPVLWRAWWTGEVGDNWPLAEWSNSGEKGELGLRKSDKERGLRDEDLGAACVNNDMFAPDSCEARECICTGELGWLVMASGLAGAWNRASGGGE